MSVGISINDYLRDHVSIIYWIKHVALYVLPEPLVLWLFKLPALVYFPLRVVMSVIIGWWALGVAKRIGADLDQ